MSGTSPTPCTMRPPEPVMVTLLRLLAARADALAQRIERTQDMPRVLFQVDMLAPPLVELRRLLDQVEGKLQ